MNLAILKLIGRLELYLKYAGLWSKIKGDFDRIYAASIEEKPPAKALRSEFISSNRAMLAPLLDYDCAVAIEQDVTIILVYIYVLQYMWYTIHNASNVIYYIYII